MSDDKLSFYPSVTAHGGQYELPCLSAAAEAPMTPDDLPLFTWHPSHQVIVFPMIKRTGRIRDVAAKMLDKRTDRAAAFYREQVTDAMLRSMTRAGIPEVEQDEQIGEFWSAVQAEMIRLTYRGQRPGGTPHDKAHCSPGEHSHPDRPNFTLEDWIAMCNSGEAKFSVAEAARVMGVSRAYVYRCMLYASIPEDAVRDVLDEVIAKGLTSTTAVADEIKRRTGKAKAYTETCPHCGGELRRRVR